MIVENITVDAASLNTGIDVVKSVSVTSIAKNDAEALLKKYVPVQFLFSNVSGVAVNVIVFSALEYAQYLLAPTVSDKITIANNTTLALAPTKEPITKIVVLGSVGHVGNLNITVIKE